MPSLACTLLLLIVASSVDVAATNLTTFSCQPIEDDVDYESVPSQVQRTSRELPESCCEDCRRFESVCDYFTWTSEDGGTCELKKLVLPQTKVARPGAKTSLLVPCRCTTGGKCDASGVCTGCSLFGTCYNYDKAACTHGGGKMCDGTSASTTRRPTTTTSTSTILPSTTAQPPLSTLSPTPSLSTTPEPSTTNAIQPTTSPTPPPPLVTGTAHGRYSYAELAWIGAILMVMGL